MVSSQLGRAAVDEAFKDHVSGLFAKLCLGMTVDHNPKAVSDFRKALGTAMSAQGEAIQAVADITGAPDV